MSDLQVRIEYARQHLDNRLPLDDSRRVEALARLADAEMHATAAERCIDAAVAALDRESAEPEENAVRVTDATAPTDQRVALRMENDLMNCPHCGQPMPELSEVEKAMRGEAGVTREKLGDDGVRERPREGDERLTGGHYRP